MLDEITTLRIGQGQEVLMLRSNFEEVLLCHVGSTDEIRFDMKRSHLTHTLFVSLVKHSDFAINLEFTLILFIFIYHCVLSPLIYHCVLSPLTPPPTPFPQPPTVLLFADFTEV